MGYVHLYTGNGKGKTTAATGLALRALGAGMKVFFMQFVKGQDTGELKSLERFGEQIRIRQCGRDCFVRRDASEEDIRLAEAALAEAEEAAQSGDYQLVILDEICIALKYKLLPLNEVLALVESRHDDAELVLTGRYASQELIEKADLVTEMTMVKHYYSDGVVARKGIEF